MTRVLITALFLSVAAGGCASSGGSSGPSRDADVITSEELRTTDIQSENAYRAVQRLRPIWLRARSSNFSGDRELPVVFVNGTRFGEIESLYNLSVTDIQRMEYLDSRDATTRFGTGYPAGAIMVTTG